MASLLLIPCVVFAAWGKIPHSQTTLQQPKVLLSRLSWATRVNPPHGMLPSPTHIPTTKDCSQLS